MSAQDFYQRPVSRPPANSWAVAALVCAIVGFFALPAEILAIIFGHIARGQIRRTGESGAGMALAALIIGYVVLIFETLLIVAFFVLLMPASTSGSGSTSVFIPASGATSFSTP